MYPIIADGGELTVLSPVASHTWGTWKVEWPESVPKNVRKDPPEGKELGYVSKLPDAPEGIMGRRFVRADVAVTASEYTEAGTPIAYTGVSNVETVLDHAAGRTKGGVFLERDITTANLTGHTPGVDFQLGDVVPVEIWGKRTRLPVTRIEALTKLGETIGWSVHLGGELIDDAAREKGLLDLERTIAKERRERKGDVAKATATATTAKQTADAARRDGVVARSDAAAAKDAAGRAVTEQVFEFAAGASRVEAPVSGWSQAYPGDEAGVVWQRSVTYFGDGRVERGPAVVTTGAPGQRGPLGPKGDPGKDGVPGKAGVGVSSTTVAYAVSTSGTVHPTTGWQSQPPAANPGQFMWTKLTLRYTDGTAEDVYSVGMIGETGPQGPQGAKGATGATGATGPQGPKGATGSDGRPGKDGTTLVRTELAYASSTSGMQAPTSGWGTQPPANVPAGHFVWTRFTWHYSDKTSETGYSVGKIGETGPKGATGPKGEKGEDGGRIYDTRNDNSTPEWYIKNYPQATVKEFKWQKVVGLPGGANYTTVETTVPWMDFSGGPVEQTAQVDGKLYLRRSISGTAWSAWEEKGLKGDRGPQGPRGATGSRGVSTTSVTHFWRWAGSKPGTPTGTGNPSGWSTSQPAYQVGQKLWVTIRTLFSNGQVSWSPVTEEASVSAATAISAEAANTKNRVWYSSTVPGSTRGERPGDTWFRYSGNTVVGQWRWSGSSWINQQIGNQVIANLDAGKITSGIIDARRIGAETIDASKIKGGAIDATKIKADSITVKELRANTVIPIGASLIASEPRTPDGPPEPVWWYMDNGGRAIYSFNGKGQYVALSRAIDAQATYSPPRRLVKVQKNIRYKLVIELWASAPGSKLYIELLDQNGRHAVKKGAITDASLGAAYWHTDGVVFQETNHDKSASGYLVNNLTVPTTPTRFFALIEFNDAVEYATLGRFYFNHKNSSVKCTQRIGQFSLEPDYAEYDTVLDKMFTLAKYQQEYAEYEARSEGIGHLKHAFAISGDVFADRGCEEYVKIEPYHSPALEIKGNWRGSIAWKATSDSGEVEVGYAQVNGAAVDVKKGGIYRESTRKIDPNYSFRNGSCVCIDVYVETYKQPDGSYPSVPSFPVWLYPNRRNQRDRHG